MNIKFKILFMVLPGLIFVNLLKAEGSYDYVVAKDGSGDYFSIQSAIDATKAFPDKPVSIFIKEGIYHEKVRIYSWNTNLSLVGENKENTIITYSDFFDSIALGRNSTFHTYTLKVEANDFTMKEITVVNDAGPVGQAVALHVEGDRCRFINCCFLGHQDTLYAAGEGARQFFDTCYIEGTTDFIFGEASVIFSGCQIHSKSNSYITAASTPQHISYGFLFLNCKLTADFGIDAVYLGRPWRDHARVVFKNCEMGAHILPEGWSNWSGTERDKTAFFAEYGNYGPGAATGMRACWSNSLTEKEAEAYSIENVFQSVNKKPWNPVLDL